MTKLQWMLIVMVVGTLILAACGGPAPAAPSGGGAPAPSGAKATEVPKPSQPQEPPRQPPPAQPPSSQPSNSGSNQTGNLPGQNNIEDVTERLASLDSYKSIFTMSFDAVENGQPKQWTWTREEELSKNPPARRLLTRGAGTDASNQETIEVGGRTYLIRGDECFSAVSNQVPSGSASFTPSSIIGTIQTADLLGTETINGIPTQHFRSDLARYATSGQYTNATGEIWIAQPGGYVVKVTLDATGKDTFFGFSSADGTLHWVCELSSINQPVSIAAPTNCGAPQDIPLMADAQEQSSLGNMWLYTTPSAFDDVVAFYKKSMTANGWTENSDGMSAEGFAVLNHIKDKRTAQITIKADTNNNVTAVMITVK